MSALANISTLSLREQAARAIRAGIVTGEISPGQIYSVPAVAAELGVSATPVREAMLDLASEGLVHPVRNRGYRVASPSSADLDKILKIRLLLEVPSMGDVAESHRSEDIPPFRALAKEMPKHVRAGDMPAYLDADREFHLGLLALLDNTRLVDIVSMLRNQSRLFDVGSLLSKGELIESAEEHKEIAAAIEARDRALTEECMTKHLLRLHKVWANGTDEVLREAAAE